MPGAPHVGVDGMEEPRSACPRRSTSLLPRNCLLAQSGLLCIPLHLGIPQRSQLENGSVDTATQKWCKSSNSCSPWQLIRGCSTDPAPVPLLPPSQGQFLGAVEQSHARIPPCLQLPWVSPRQGWGPGQGHGGRVGLEGVSELVLFQPPSTTPRCSKPSVPADS